MINNKKNKSFGKYRFKLLHPAFWLVSLTVLISACGYYSFKGALPSHLKTIAIPLFDDRTPNAGVRENLTDMLTDAFIEDNSLLIVDESKADLILNGSINAITVSPAIVKAGEQVSESKLVVRVKVKCDDVKMNKVLFERNFDDYGLMDENAGLDEREAAINTALEQIVDKILNATLGGW